MFCFFLPSTPPPPPPPSKKKAKNKKQKDLKLSSSLNSFKLRVKEHFFKKLENKKTETQS